MNILNSPNLANSSHSCDVHHPITCGPHLRLTQARSKVHSCDVSVLFILELTQVNLDYSIEVALSDLSW